MATPCLISNRPGSTRVVEKIRAVCTHRTRQNSTALGRALGERRSLPGMLSEESRLTLQPTTLATVTFEDPLRTGE